MIRLHIEASDSPQAIEAIEEEIFTPAQRLHRRYNEISAHVDGLKRLIEIRKAHGEDFSRL